MHFAWFVGITCILGIAWFFWIRKIFAQRRVADNEPLFFVHPVVVAEPTTPVPQTFTNVHNKTNVELASDALHAGRGVEAFELLKAAIESERSPVAVMMIAELYKNGLHGSINPDKTTAARLYAVVVDHGNKFPADLVRTAQQQYDDLLKYAPPSTRPDVDANGGMTLPTDFPFELERILTRFVIAPRDPRAARDPQGPQGPLQQQQHPVVQELRAWNRVDPFEAVVDDNDDIRPEELEMIFRDIGRDQVRIQNDNQNVHSSTVLDCAVKVLGTCNKNPALSFGRACDLLFDACTRTQVNVGHVQKVVSAFGTDEHARFRASDKDIFVRVVDKIQSFTEPQRSNVMEILCHQLESGVERGLVVCSTGRIVRILSVFDGIGGVHEQKIVPEYVLDQELANLAAKVRTRVLKDASEDDAAAYNSGTDDKLTDQMVSVFRKESTDMYGSLVSPETLARKVDVYVEAF